MIVLVRHGETVPNRDGLLLGRADPGLTDRGLEQASDLADALAAVGPAAVVSSPLGRCVATAEVIGDALDADLSTDPRLVEIDYGDWEGRPSGRVSDDDWGRWRSDPEFAPPGGESLAAVGARVAEWCGEQTEDRPVVAVTHVSPIKAAVAWALGAGPELAWRTFVDVASITRIAVLRRGPVLLSFNERGHLRVR